MAHEGNFRTCSKDECPRFFPNHEWGYKEAQNQGWFMQRNGDAWCPDHNPGWVAEWRAKKKAKKAEKEKN